jgi:LPS-assembly protein
MADEGRAAARIAGFTITAENLSRDLERNTVSLSGHVEVSYKNQSFKADSLYIDQNSKLAILKGHVQIYAVDVEIGGDEIHLDYDSDQSVIYNGYVQSNNIQFHGQLIEQESLKKFSILDADFTTCNNCPASWSFSGSKIKAELGAYAFLKNPFLRVNGFPILWLPYLVVPLKSERQSGLLNPEFGYINNRKLVVSEGLFWAIDRSQDLTFTLKNYELGGLKQMLEYRYAQTDDSFGEFHLSHINDSVFKSEYRYNYFLPQNEKENDFSRWGFKAEQRQSLTENTYLNLKAHQISDLQYPKDFFDEFKNYAESGLENRVTLSSANSNSLFSLDLVYFKHLLEANPLSDNSAAVHKLPEVRFDTQLQKIGQSPVYYKINFDGANFYRPKKYDDISVGADGQKYVANQSANAQCDHTLNMGSLPSDCDRIEDGIYNEGTDILRTGQRLNFKTTLTTEAYTLSALNITPQMSYADTQYFFPEGNQKYNHRRLVEFDVMSRSKLYRLYESSDTTVEKKYKHELIPEVTYTWLPWIDQEAHPFFGNFQNSDTPFKSADQINDTDINSTNQNSLQFDTSDRVYERHIIKFSLLNRVIKKIIKDASYVPLLTFNISQSYDLYQTQAKQNINKPLSNLNGTLDLTLNTFSFNQQINYSPYEYATDSESTLIFRSIQGQYFKLGYVSKRINQATKLDDLALAVGFVTTYLNLVTGVIIDTSENRNSDSRLKKHSLIAQFKPPGECWGINFFRDQKIGADAEWKVRFEFSFDGKPQKVIPPDELKLTY